MDKDFICVFCGKVCKNLNSLRQHEIRCKLNPNRIPLNSICFKGHKGHKGHKGGNQYTKAKETGIPHIMSDETKQKISNAAKGRKLSAEHKKKISNSMVIAHKENRAHNIGQSRWNNEPSYPEKWFMEVIENEFENKNYIREFPFHRFSLDFAWVDLKVCVEIDSEQHLRFDDYHERDLIKDSLLKDEGWIVIRIPWKDCFADPKKYIKLVKQYIDK